MNLNSQDHVGDLDRARQAILSLARAASITQNDLAILRREVSGAVSLCREEVEALFTLDRLIGNDDEEWANFFVPTVTDHLVWACRPTGLINDADARWLLAHVDQSRTIASFEILVNVLSEAHQVPTWFASAVRQRSCPNCEDLVAPSFEPASQRRYAA